MQQDGCFGEVIESSLHSFVVQCWEWDRMPVFGALVMIQNDDCILFGVVHKITTGPVDAIRTPFAYRKTQEELKRDQPHIFEFLRTTCECITVGYWRDRSLWYMMALRPPTIHAFVSFVRDELARQFFSSADYLYVLHAAQNGIAYMDELLLAMVTHSLQQGYIQPQNLKQFMNVYVLLIGNEYRRIKLFARRVQSVLTS